MSDTVTVSVEIPVDDLRVTKLDVQDDAQFHRDRLNSSTSTTFRSASRFFLACIDTPLPPEPIKVGDRVDVCGGGRGTVLAIDDEWAWLQWNRPHGIRESRRVGTLTRVED